MVEEVPEIVFFVDHSLTYLPGYTGKTTLRFDSDGMLGGTLFGHDNPCPDGHFG